MMRVIAIIGLCVGLVGCADNDSMPVPEESSQRKTSAPKTLEKDRVALGEVISDAGGKTKFTMEVTLPQVTDEVAPQEQ